MGANVELAASTLATLRDDPLLAWRSWFSEDLWPRGWQIEALEDWRNPRNRRLAYVTARGAGKSRFAAFCILHDAATRHEGLILIVSPSERQRRVSTWQEVALQFSQSPVLPRLFPQWQVLADRIDTGRPELRVESAATNDPSGVEGYHARPYVSMFLDEAQNLADEYFDSLQGVGPSRLVATGVGGADEGFFARAFSTDRWAWDVTRRIPATEVPELRELAARERRRNGANSPIYRRHWLAEFCSESEFSIFDEITLNRARGVVPPLRNPYGL